MTDIHPHACKESLGEVMIKVHHSELNAFITQLNIVTVVCGDIVHMQNNRSRKLNVIFPESLFLN